MKVFITVKLTILTLLLAFNVYSQPNPDFDPFAKKLPIPHNPKVYKSSEIVSYWDTIRTTPNAYSRSACAYFTLSGVKYIYQFGGGIDTQTTLVARYNVTDGTWSTNFTRIPSGMSGATALTVGNFIYLFGGESVSGLGKTYKYDPANDSWTTMAAMPTPVTDAAVFNYDDNLIYVIGGGNGLFGTGWTYSNTVQIYNIASNSYSSGTNYPISVGMMGVGNWRDTLICVGGYTGVTTTDAVYRGIINKTNPTQITWSSTAYPKYPAGPVTRPASVNIRFGNATGVLFAGGALNGVNSLANAFYWDFNLLMWRALPDMIVPKCNSKAVFSGDSVAYLIAGYSILPSGRNDKITFLKIEGVSNSLNDFSLRYPVNNSTVTSVIGSKLPALFTWDSSGTGAIYKWSFEKTGDPNKRLDSIIVGINVLKLTENDLDVLLASKLNINQGDSVVGKWYVYAYKGPGAPGNRDTIPSREIFNVTLKRYKPTLSAFNLVSPVNGSILTTSSNFTYPVNFIWTKAAPFGTTYKMYYVDTVKNKIFTLQGGNFGTDSLVSISNKKLDSLLDKAITIGRGDTSWGKWYVYAYSTTDSLISAQSYNITFIRTKNDVSPFTLILPPDSTVITVSNFSTINFVWHTSAVGANYKWQFSTNASFTPFISLPANNSGYDSLLTLQTSDLIGLIGVTGGNTVSGFWRAYAFKGTDSTPSTNKFVIKFVNQSNQQLLQKFKDVEPFPPLGWNIQYTGNSSWQKSTYTSPYPMPYDTTSSGCAKFDFFNTQKGVKQSLVSNIFYATNSEPATPNMFDTLMFDYAHAYFGAANIDSLLIFYSTRDTGAIQDTLVFLASDPDFGKFKSLSTITYQNGAYVPSNSDWRTKKIALPDGTRRVKFLALSGWGNNLYIDNIRNRNKAPWIIANRTPDVLHTILFQWYKSSVPSTYYFQVANDTDSKFVNPYINVIAGFDITTFSPNYYFLAYHKYQWRMRLFNSADSSNWSKPVLFKIDSATVLKQNFASSQFPPFPWDTTRLGDTLNYNMYWSAATVGGNTLSTTAAKFDYFNCPYGITRALTTNTFVSRYFGQNDTLYFDIAHAYKNSVNIDTLLIYTSTNYGGTWGTANPLVTLVSSQYKDSVYSMSTTTQTTEFTPSTASHWKTLYYPLNPTVNKIMFKTLSANGNNLYITNVRLGPDYTLKMTALEPPLQYKLNLNYPNPFNPTTTISFSIPKTSLTKLVIYDVLGREMTKIVNEVLQPGNYSKTFNATNLSSGVYFYRLEAGDFVDVKKMLLIK